MGRPPVAAALLTAGLLVPPLHAPSSMPLAQRELRLTNTQWDQVQVEVRVGVSKNCDANPIVGTKILGRDRTWGIVTDQVICWRREQIPGDLSSGWTLWQQARLALDEVREVSL